jgi:hypothetical protein
MLLIVWRIVQILRERRRKITNTVLITLSAIQAASQSTFINANKNKQLTLISQSKLAFTGRNMLMNI